MKYVLLALAILFSATASAEVYENLSIEDFNKLAQQLAQNSERLKKLPGDEYMKEQAKSLGSVEDQHAYYGSGYKIADHDVYILSLIHI